MRMNKNIYKQTDPRWKNLPYPTRRYTFGGSGCGCCAVTHAIIEIPKYAKYDPRDTRPYMVQYATCGDGTKRVGITAGLKHYGLENVFRCEGKPMSSLFAQLDSGSSVGALLFGSKLGPDGTKWTSGGHYIGYCAYKKVGNKHWFYLKDSSKRASSHIDINGKRVYSGHSGWWCYENSMKGDVHDAWSAKLPQKSVTKYLNVDGKFGPQTVKALQKYLKVKETGTMNEVTVKALQTFLNKNVK